LARYRTKDEIDILWNQARRHLTRELDTQIADWREIALNKILGTAWEEFQKAISTGEKLQIEATYSEFVSSALADVIDIEVTREAA
jgi:hypothetical protein